MALTTSLLSEHRRALSRVVWLAERDVRRLWALTPKSDAAVATRVLVEALPAITDTYGEVTASLAADMYDEARPRTRAPFRAVTSPPAPRAQVEVLARWAVTPLWSEMPDNVAAFLRLAGGTQRLVTQPARDTITASVWADPARPGYARHPNPGACDFCLILASRETMYASAASAFRVGSTPRGPRGTQRVGDRFHDSCRCTAVPVFTPDDLPDVNRRLQQAWRDTKGQPADQRREALAAAATPGP